MMTRARSQLHLQLGQEVIYLLMALGILTSLILLAKTEHLPMPLPVPPQAPSAPECTLPGRGPCYGPGDLPPCMRSQRGCMLAVSLPPCMRSEHGCMPAVKLPDCMQPGKGPCISAQEPKKPAILNLTEREGFRFASGSYVINPEFMANLRNDIVPEIVRLGDELHARVVEVVGYTDSVRVLQDRKSTPDQKLNPTPVSQDRMSTLDQKLNAYLSGDKTLSGNKAVVMVDNVGLGMMRAAAVVRALKDMPQLKNRGFIFLAMSAGQTIGPDDRPIGPESRQAVGDEGRRRVEIRLRQPLHEADQGNADQGKGDQ